MFLFFYYRLLGYSLYIYSRWLSFSSVKQYCNAYMWNVNVAYGYDVSSDVY